MTSCLGYSFGMNPQSLTGSRLRLPSRLLVRNSSLTRRVPDELFFPSSLRVVSYDKPERKQTTMSPQLLRLNGTLAHDPAIDTWMNHHPGELGTIAHHWFEAMRRCGDEVREILHDGCPVACLGDAPFAYVNVFTAHVNVGFFQGASLPDPTHLLQGAGKCMRHVKLRPGTAIDAASLSKLIERAYADIKTLVENS